MRPYEALLQYWLETGTGIDTPHASGAEVAKLEAHFGVRFPEDFRDYLLNAAPRLGESMDKNLTTWWDVSRIASEQTINGRLITIGGDPVDEHKYLIFADYMIWCWAWAIACGDTDQRGKIIVLGDTPGVVADNFATFVDFRIKDIDSLGPAYPNGSKVP